jgi:membrane fusion protein (multidrug efflux system)
MNLLSGCRSGNSDNGNAFDAVPVEVAHVVRRTISASYIGTAALEPRTESQVVAKTSGIALEVLVEEGQMVYPGQALVWLDPDRPRLAVAQTEAQMRKLENSYRRAERLIAHQLISANEVDQLRYDLANARAQYHLAQLELSYTTVTSPIAGVIASRSIKTGNFVQINTPIFRVIDNSHLEATLNIPERELATIRAGQPVRLQVDALPGQTFNGTVDRVAPVVDSGSGTFRAICTFAGNGQLQPGMFGRIRIDYDERVDALAIPRLALLDDQSEPSVFVVRDGKAQRVTLETGYTDSGWVEVHRGLNPGEAVVTAGKVALRDGRTVQIVNADSSATNTTSRQPTTAGSMKDR